jgi:predicted ATPase
MLALVGGASSKTFSSTFTPIFDFDIESLKQTAQPLSGKKDLAEDGSNLALVLRNLLRDETKRRRFSNLMTTLLPFAEDLRVHERADPSLRITLKESYAEDRLLPASLLSDGTLQAVALIVALYFDDRPVIAFEEPTRGLHPKLISQLVQMMREVATEKQLLVTTHNPELMKHVGLENVYLVSRNDEGFTHVTKPADKKTVQTFLEHDLGVDDLFVQNLL